MSAVGEKFDDVPKRFLDSRMGQLHIQTMSAFLTILIP